MTPREPEHVRLLRKADAAEQAAGGLPGRGAALLRVLADAYRAAAGIYASDPTLRGCPAGRERDLDLIGEYGRQIPLLVRQAVRGDHAERWPIEERWAEVEAMAGRLPVILDRARAVARPDHADPEVSRAISHLWLIAAAPHIVGLAEQIAEAIVKAGGLPHVCPEVGRVGELAQELTILATALKAMHPLEQA